ncbi:hypothetical protein AMATHDRAFT_2625 [Amanita thiersii Skay4041]|uniref:Glutaredoxin domain-containing protein n=1 Tax=Amanita thiersii Skay4041 TaxID=703135 RepID=A0A2A9NUH1_9AGAR|nr:hypothetical protein AMATHDRAFT_2625 [Amanita thiersii Skay4041]
MAPPPASSSSPIRRSRGLLLIVFVIALFFLFVPRHQLSSALQDTGISKEKLVNYFGSSKPDVDEIYGLLHLVTGDVEKQAILSSNPDIDPTKPVDFSVYAGGRRWMDWKEETRRIDANYPIVVFSKSYCPYSNRAKKLLASYDIRPPPHIVEVDLRDDSNVIKALLTRLTKHSTFPNILVLGKSIGGSDDLANLHASQRLEKILQEAGAVVRSQEA